MGVRVTSQSPLPRQSLNRKCERYCGLTGNCQRCDYWLLNRVPSLAPICICERYTNPDPRLSENGGGTDIVTRVV